MLVKHIEKYKFIHLSFRNKELYILTRKCVSIIYSFTENLIIRSGNKRMCIRALERGRISMKMKF